MKVFSIRRRQLLPISIEEAWAFFSSPHNLAKITPLKMNLQIFEIGDEISYSVPDGPIGLRVNALFVEREVNAIFDHRYNVLRELFSAKLNVTQL
jgi:ligand-binding SRPBCC domain-containing protein